jgi:hypothetical protein
VIPEVCAGPGEPGLVSVLIPSYNRAYILATAIDSVLAQTYRPIEVIVVDDGSRDDTRAVVARYGDQVRYIHQSNGGLAAARNTGLAAARGEFIAFEDSDDAWLPWKLKVQVAVLQRFPQVALTWTDMTAISEQGTQIAERYLRTGYSPYGRFPEDELFPHTARVGDVCPDCAPEVADAVVRYGDIFSSMFIGNLVHPPTVLMRRDAVHRAGGLDLAFNATCEDYEFFCRVARWGQGALVDAPGMLYRIGADDQGTHPTRGLYQARGYLAAVQRRLVEDRDRLQLPASVIQQTLAEAYAWVGNEEFAVAAGLGAALFIWKSLRLNWRQGHLLKLLPLSLLPPPLFRLVRSLKHRVSGAA